MKHDYGTEPIKNALDRMKVNLFNSKAQTKKLYLMTKKDGSQRYIKAASVELYVDDNKLVVYQPGQCIHGTIYTNVVNVEEVTESE